MASFYRKLAVISITLLVALFSVQISLANGFKDVMDHTQYASSINFLHDRQLVVGLPDGTYHPERPINRAELLKVVMLAKQPADLFDATFTYPCADDLPLDNWATRFMCYAKMTNIMQGYPDNTLKPWQSVTYVEALKIMMNSLGLQPANVSDPWYEAYLKYADQAGISVPGAAPFLPINRAQMAELLSRIVQHNESANPGAPAPYESNDLSPSEIQPSYIPTEYQVPAPVVSANDISAHNGYYENIDGFSVARPYESITVPADATALCKDGYYSSSQHRSGTCRGHQGVAVWLREVN